MKVQHALCGARTTKECEPTYVTSDSLLILATKAYWCNKRQLARYVSYKSAILHSKKCPNAKLKSDNFILEFNFT